jgi:hypothetical protein
MSKETREQIMQRALAALAFADGVHERLAARRALAEEQLKQEAEAFTERRTQDVLAGMETPPERDARIKAGLKARWAQSKARALATIASVEATDWNQKRNSPPQSLLSRLNQRYRNAKTTAERREIRMLILAELRKDNPSPRGTIYKMRHDAATPFERYQNAKTPAEKREAFKQMAALYMKKHGRRIDD